MEPMADLSEDPIEIGRRLCAVLDPLMTSQGFQPGQVGSSPSEVGIVYCAPHGDFRARFPDLAPGIEDTDEGACTDLNIYLTLGASAHLRDVHLDGHGLDELLHGAGRPDLRAHAASLAQVPVDEGAERLRTVLTAVFARPSRSETTGEEDSDV